MLDHRLQRRTPCLLLQLQAGDNCPRHETFVDDWRQVDEPDAVGVPADQLAGQLLSESGLAAAAWTGQRQQPGSRLEVLELAELILAADECRQLDGQVGEMPRQGPDRRKPGGTIKIDQLEDLLWALQVLEPMQPEIPHLGTGGGPVRGEPRPPPAPNQ